MSDAVNSAASTPPSNPVAEVRATRAETKSAPAPTDIASPEKVTLSSAAQAALREASETPAETAKEANGGDVQAKHLLAKRATDKAARSSRLHVLA
jgi:hypothetical protein